MSNKLSNIIVSIIISILIIGTADYWLAQHKYFGITQKIEQFLTKYSVWVIASVILLILSTGFFIWKYFRFKNLQKELSKHNILYKKIKNLKLTDFGLKVPGLKKQKYFHRDKLDSGILSILEKDWIVLIVGRPNAGKTRTAFETIIRNYPKHRILSLPPVFEKKDVPTEKLTFRKTVLFLDDVHKVQYDTDVQGMIREVLKRKDNRVVATVRAGRELEDFEKKEFLKSEFRSRRIEIKDLDRKEVQEINDFFELPKGKDGAAIGEMLIDFEDIRKRYNDLSNESTGILRTIRLLYRSGIYIYSWKWIIRFLSARKNLNIADKETIYKEIERCQIVYFRDDEIKLASDTYIEKVIEDFPLSDFETKRQHLIDFCYEEKNADFLYYIGNQFAVVEEKYEGAIKCYDKVVEIKGDYPEAWNNRGTALGNLGENEKAIESYDKAIEYKPDYPVAWYNRGNVYSEKGEYEKAILEYDEALRLKPDLHIAWYNRGNALADLGKFREAIKNYDKAIEHNPEYPKAWNNRGNALASLGKIREAIKCYNKAIEHKSDYPEAWYNRGFAFMT